MCFHFRYSKYEVNQVLCDFTCSKEHTQVSQDFVKEQALFGNPKNLVLLNSVNVVYHLPE